MVKEVIFKNIAEYYKADIYRYSKYMLKDDDEAEDVAQEVVIKFWHNFEDINLLSVKSWLIRTTHNLCIDMLRKRKKIIKNSIRIDEATENLASVDAGEVSYYSEKELGKVIQSKIEQLPDNLKSIFILYEIENYKYKEISKILDLPVNSIKVNLFRARKKLRELLRSEYEEITQ